MPNKIIYGTLPIPEVEFNTKEILQPLDLFYDSGFFNGDKVHYFVKWFCSLIHVMYWSPILDYQALLACECLAWVTVN